MSGGHPGNITRGPDGETYPSQRAAAEALGVSEQAINRHLTEYGSLDNLGNRGRPGKRVRGPGYDYPTMTACAADIGVDVSMVSRWIRQGQRDLLAARIAMARKGEA